MGNAIGDGAAGDLTDIDGEIAAVIGQGADVSNEIGELENSVGSRGMLSAGVGGLPFGADAEGSAAFAGGDKGNFTGNAAVALENEAGSGVGGEDLSAEITKILRNDFLAGVEENDPVGGGETSGVHFFEGQKGEPDEGGAAFDIIGAGAVDAVADDFPAEVVADFLLGRIDGVEVGKEGNGGPGDLGTSESEVVAESGVKSGGGSGGKTEGGKLASDQIGIGGDAGAVFGEAVEADHLAEEIEGAGKGGLAEGGEIVGHDGMGCE